ESIVALRTQPPFNASAMDGYAMRGADAHITGSELAVIGEVAAGSMFSGSVEAGQCVRIFTGAPLPAGTDTVVIQENVDRPAADDVIRLREPTAAGRNVRRAGLDFTIGDLLVEKGHLMRASALSLA